MKPISRRHFVGMACAGIASATTVPFKFCIAKNQVNHQNIPILNNEEMFFSASGSDEKKYGISWVKSKSQNINSQFSTFRGHSVVINPKQPNYVLMLGRRPSTQIIRVNIKENKVDKIIGCEPNRHLYGHGCFSHDGERLYTAEAPLDNDLKANSLDGSGIIVVRDSETLKKIDEFDSEGIGPHEIKFLPDSDILIVANGGILTRPETGRTKLNLDTMKSNLSYFDIKSRQLISKVSVAESKASIRHIDVANDGTVAIGMQVQRKVTGHNRVIELAASHKLGNEIKLFNKPEALVSQMDDYVGSVAIHPTNKIAGFTSPKGNLVAFWNTGTGAFINYHLLQDVCGICITQDASHFVISNSKGQLRFIDSSTLIENKEKRKIFRQTRWDNHLTRHII